MYIQALIQVQSDILHVLSHISPCTFRLSAKYIRSTFKFVFLHALSKTCTQTDVNEAMNESLHKGKRFLKLSLFLLILLLFIFLQV